MEIRASLCMALSRQLSDGEVELSVMEAGETVTDLDDFEI